MRGLEWDREYCHSRAEGEPLPQSLEIPEDVDHHCQIETKLHALG